MNPSNLNAKKRNALLVMSAILFLAFVLFCFLKSQALEKDMKTNGVQVHTTILHAVPDTRHKFGCMYECSFVYKGELKKLYYYGEFVAKDEMMKGRSVAGIYSEKYDNVNLLLWREDSIRFGLLK